MSIWHKTYTTSVSSTEKNFQCFYLPILWTTQSCWQRGQRLFCFTHKDMQQLWKEWLHSPQTTEREKRTRSSHAQMSDQHLQQGPNYSSQMFKATANLQNIWKDKMHHCWFIHRDWINTVILMILLISTSRIFSFFFQMKRNMYILTFFYKVFDTALCECIKHMSILTRSIWVNSSL